MPTLKNAASRSIGEQLRIGDGKTQWTIPFAQRRPEAVDVTVHEKGRRVEAMREEGAVKLTLLPSLGLSRMPEERPPRRQG